MRLRATRLACISAGNNVNPLAFATWLLFDGAGNLSPLVQSGATSMGWLFDETGTLKARPHNLFSRSEDFENAAFTKTFVTIAPGVVASPFGPSSGRKLLETATTGVHEIRSVSLELVAGAEYEAQISAKEAERRYFRVGFAGAWGVANNYAVIDLRTGAVTFRGNTNLVVETVSQSDGWWRIFVRWRVVTTATNTLYYGINYDETTGTSAVGDTSSGVFISAMQINLGDRQPYYRTGTYNLLQFTEAFENAVWVKTGVNVIANAALADKVVPTGAGAFAHYFGQAGLTTVAGQTYTLTFSAKADGYNWIQLSGASSQFGSQQWANFDVANGVVGASGVTQLKAEIFPEPDGYWRCSITIVATTSSTTTSAYALVLNANTNQRFPAYQADEVSGVLFKNAQLVQGSDPLPYEPILGTTPAPAAYYGPRVSYDPANLSLGPFLLAEEQRTNSIRNNTMQGAVAGTPGTLPTNWAENLGTTGLTRQIVGTGTQQGITYIDIRWSGTIASTSAALVFFGFNSEIAALPNQTWTASSWVSLVGGSLNGVAALALFLRFNGSNGSFLTAQNSSIMSVSGGLTRFNLPLLATSADTAFVNSGINGTFTVGTAVDFTLRIGLPQLELGSTASSPILTSGSAVTRAADNLSVTNLGATGFNATEGTLYADFQSATGATGVPCAISLDDNTLNHRIQLRRASSDAMASLRMVSASGSVDQTQPNGTAGGRHRQAVSFVAGAQSWASNGALIGGFTPLAALPVVNRLQFGQGPGSNALQGRVFNAAIIPRRISDAGLQQITRL